MPRAIEELVGEVPHSKLTAEFAKWRRSTSSAVPRIERAQALERLVARERDVDAFTRSFRTMALRSVSTRRHAPTLQVGQVPLMSAP